MTGDRIAALAEAVFRGHCARWNLTPPPGLTLELHRPAWLPGLYVLIRADDGTRMDCKVDRADHRAIGGAAFLWWLDHR